MSKDRCPLPTLYVDIRIALGFTRKPTNDFGGAAEMEAHIAVGALVLLSCVMADKSKIEASRDLNRKARPWAILIITLTLFLFFGYPLLQ